MTETGKRARKVSGTQGTSLGVRVITLSYQLGGYVKEPVALFEKSRVPRPRCRGLSDLCR